MVSAASDLITFVITLDAVKASIEILRDSPIHQYFPAYLHLRQEAARRGSSDALVPRWNEVAAYLDVPGSEFGRPYFRPFNTRNRDAATEWLNPNLAGSYAASSLRIGQPALNVVKANGDGTFSLRADHWKLARLHLCEAKPIPVIPLAAYYFRNHGFLASEMPKTEDLITEFRSTFGYRPDDEEEFQHLYVEFWSGPSLSWFEEWEIPGDDEDA